jgi:glutathione S-transferase
MVWVELVTAAALLQYLAFGTLVGRARVKYGVAAPAISGHAAFERLYRVQANTLEMMVAFVPSLWLAAKYWSPGWISALGALYVIGRFVYFSGYTKDPAKRVLGFQLSLFPVAVLLVAALVGMAKNF